MKKIKIALIRGPFFSPNGVLPWDYIHQEKAEVSITGFESHPSRFDNSELSFPVKKLIWPGGLIDLFGYKYFFSKVSRFFHFSPYCLMGIRNIIKSYDIIHTSENFTNFSFLAAIYSFFYSKRFCFSAGENIPYPLKQRNPLTWLMKSFVNFSADNVFATTIEGKRALIHEGMRFDKIDVLPNAVDTLKFMPMSNVKPEDISKKLSSNNRREISILFVHRLCEQKGTPYLIKAFQDLASEISVPVRLILVGENRLSSQDFKTIEMNKDIIHLPYVDPSSMPILYNLVDIVILPSVTMVNNEEQFGRAVIEAMACGIPTIVTDVGGLPHVVKEGVTSLVIPERSSLAIKNALLNLIVDEALREKLSRQSLIFVRNSFSKEIVGEKLYSLYRNKFPELW